MKPIRTLLILFLVGAGLLHAQPVHAEECHSWTLLCLFGVTDVVTSVSDGYNARKVAEKNIDREIQERKALADQQLEQFKSARYESDNQRQIAIRNAELAHDTYIQQLDGYKAVQLKQLDANIAANHDQADIAQRGIVEAGQTARMRLAWDGTYNIVTILVIAAVLGFFIYRRTKPASGAQPTVILMAPANEYLPWPDCRAVQPAASNLYDQAFWDAVAQARPVEQLPNNVYDLSKP
jgi:hypothetical protein